jgi:hypothetical protein
VKLCLSCAVFHEGSEETRCSRCGSDLLADSHEHRERLIERRVERLVQSWRDRGVVDATTAGRIRGELRKPSASAKASGAVAGSGATEAEKRRERKRREREERQRHQQEQQARDEAANAEKEKQKQKEEALAVALVSASPVASVPGGTFRFHTTSLGGCDQ